MKENRSILTIEYLLLLGCTGPFGRIFMAKDTFSMHQFWTAYPATYVPQLKTENKVLPIQSDGYNCGIYLVFSMQDFILTQWDKRWTKTDVLGVEENKAEEAWKQLIEAKQSIKIPHVFGLGKAFVSQPETTDAKVYKRFCDYMRMEMCLLMERIHCIYVEAFSRRNCRTMWWKLGVARERYRKAILQDKDMIYVHQRQFMNADFSTIDIVKALNLQEAAIHMALQSGLAVFPRHGYCNAQGDDSIVRTFSSNEYLKQLSKTRLLQTVRDELQELADTQMMHLCKHYESSVGQFREREGFKTKPLGPHVVHKGDIASPETVGTNFSPKRSTLKTSMTLSNVVTEIDMDVDDRKPAAKKTNSKKREIKQVVAKPKQSVKITKPSIPLRSPGTRKSTRESTMEMVAITSQPTSVFKTKAGKQGKSREVILVDATVSPPKDASSPLGVETTLIGKEKGK